MTKDENYNRDREVIYTEETIILIKPLKARVFKEEFQIIESYSEDGEKVVLLREKIIKE